MSECWVQCTVVHCRCYKYYESCDVPGHRYCVDYWFEMTICCVAFSYVAFGFLMRPNLNCRIRGSKSIFARNKCHDDEWRILDGVVLLKALTGFVPFLWIRCIGSILLFLTTSTLYYEYHACHLYIKYTCLVLQNLRATLNAYLLHTTQSIQVYTVQYMVLGTRVTIVNRPLAY